MPMKTATFRPLSALLGPLGPMAGCISSISTQQTQRHLQNRLPDRFRGPDWTPLNGPGGVYFSEPKWSQEALPRAAPHVHRLSRC